MGENIKKFVFGGLAGMSATVVVQPLDLIKTRMQIAGSMGKSYNGTLDCLKTVAKNEGILKFYAGLSAALLRQATYTTGRLGVYTYLNDKYKSSYNQAPGLIEQMGMGLTAGAFGAGVGTPAEVALIRMTADGQKPISERRNYKGVLNALVRIIREEGVLALWRGCIPTMGRAMIVNMTQLASYSQVKGYLVNKFELSEGIGLHFSASMVSGFLTTVASMPVDIAKTRIQNMKTINGKPEYKGAIDCLVKVVRNEGFFALWKGFVPYYCRLTPHTVLTFIFLEKFNYFYNVFYLGGEDKGSGM